MNRACSGVTSTGQPCKAAVRSGRDFCWFHDPECTEDRERARRRGGKRRWKDYLARASIYETTAAGVLLYLEDVMESLQRPNLPKGEIARYRAATYAAAVALKAVEQADLALRIKAVEDALGAREEII
jgi:hypothetical protein